MLISLLVCRAFFLLAIVLLIAICTMLIGIHFHEYYYPMNHFQTLAYLEIFYYSPLFILLKKYWTLLLFLHILFNTLAHLPTPFPSPMSIDEYFEITLKSPSVSKTWKTVFTVEISFSFLAEKCKQIIRIYAKWEQIQIRAQVHWKVVSSARFSRQVGFKIDRKTNILKLKLLYLQPTSIFEKSNQSNSKKKKKSVLVLIKTKLGFWFQGAGIIFVLTDLCRLGCYDNQIW